MRRNRFSKPRQQTARYRRYELVNTGCLPSYRSVTAGLRTGEKSLRIFNEEQPKTQRLPTAPTCLRRKAAMMDYAMRVRTT